MLNRIYVLNLILLSLLSGCGTVIKHLDSSWLDNKIVYRKAKPLPPLEIPPELASPRIPRKSIN